MFTSVYYNQSEQSEDLNENTGTPYAFFPVPEVDGFPIYIPIKAGLDLATRLIGFVEEANYMDS